MVTDQERQLIRRVFSQGPGALLDEGYTPETAHAFLQRDDVRQEWSLLEREYANSDAIDARTKFVTRKQLARLKDGAVAVLARALAGPVYARDQQGNILRDALGRPLMTDAGPTSIQVAAANTVLDRLGVVADAEVARVDGTALNNMLAPSAEKGKLALPENPNLKSPEEQALARERVRNILEMLAAALPSARAKLDGVKLVEAAVVDPKTKKAKKAKGKKPANDTVSKGG